LRRDSGPPPRRACFAIHTSIARRPRCSGTVHTDPHSSQRYRDAREIAFSDTTGRAAGDLQTTHAVLGTAYLLSTGTDPSRGIKRRLVRTRPAKEAGARAAPPAR
jgi:hypothetical protein